MTLVRAGLCLAASLGVASCYSVPVSRNVPTKESAYTLIAPGSAAYRNEAHRIEPQDTLSVTVFQEPDLSVTATSVDRLGFLPLPLLGPVKAAGKTSDELAKDIAGLLTPRFVLHPHVTVTVVTAALQRITVEGEVRQPGIYPVTGPTTLTQAIALAKGTPRTARLEDVVVFRTINGQRMAARFNLKYVRAARDPDPELAPDDVVVVGFSEARGAWEDFLRTFPVLNVFGPL